MKFIFTPMKTSIKIAAFTFAMFGFTVAANAQSTDGTTATASASVVAPIAIETVQNISFGEVLTSGVQGAVVLTPQGSRSGSAVSSANAGTAVTAATFRITGQTDYLYTVTVPVSATISTTGETPVSMTVNSFTTTLDGTSGVGSITDGDVEIGVGATLVVGANQAAGAYSGSFAVTVEYN